MSGTRRALLLGAQTFGLRGVHADVDAVAEHLAGAGFGDVRRCTGGDATRAGLLAALEELVARTGPGDAVVVYWSGHGARDLLPGAAARRAAGRSAYVQYLVPVDLAASTEADFRGLLAAELSDVQRRLTALTPNVTTVLDCCHAGAMARDPALRLRATTPRVPLAGAVVRLAELEARDAPGAEANPLAVRLVASELDRSAYEGPTARGGVGGVFTDALLTVLAGTASRPVPWRVVLRRVRELLRARDAVQRPGVEGPAGRLPFSVEEPAVPDGLPVRGDGPGWRVEAGALLGLGAGDLLRLVAPDGRVVGEARVGAADGADVLLEDVRGAVAADGPAAADGVVAVPVGSRRHPVVVEVAGTPGEEVRERVAASPWLAVATAGAGAGAGALRVADVPQGLAVLDPAGTPARTTALPATAAGAARAVDLLELLATAERFRRLDDDAPGDLAVEVAVQVAARGAGSPADGAGGPPGVLHAGERLLVSVRNLARARVFAWLLDVGVSGRVSLVSNDLPDGRPLEAAGRFGDGHVFGAPDGVRFSWPADVPAGAPRPETLLVVVAHAPADLSVLQTGAAAREVPGLPAVLAEAAGARVRSGAGAGSRCVVRAVDLLLHPAPRTGG
ncbi:hypothetical protein NUM3379_11910 [Kineococcus sp. NUM-3379]